MGKKSKWFSAMKRALVLPFKSSEKLYNGADIFPAQDQTPEKEKGQGDSGKLSSSVLLTSSNNPNSGCDTTSVAPAEGDSWNTLAAAEAAVSAANTATTIAKLSKSGKEFSYSGEYKAEWAAIKIQTTFRGYLSRRALRALKALVRLQALVRGNAVRRQTGMALRCMQALVRVQTRVRAKRSQMLEEAQTAHILRNRLFHQEASQNALSSVSAYAYEGWDSSTQPIEELQARKHNKQEAAKKRERTLAYSVSQQSCRSGPFDASLLEKPHWGWNWLDRWMAARPWETRGFDKPEEPSRGNDYGSVKFKDVSLGRSRSKRKCLKDYSTSTSALKTDLVMPHSPVTPHSLSASIPYLKCSDSRGSPAAEEEIKTARSTPSLKIPTSRYCSKSVCTGSIKSNESLLSTCSVPNYMSPTQSARAKARSPSTPRQRPQRPDLLSAKKRLSFPPPGSPKLNCIQPNSAIRTHAHQTSRVCMSSTGYFIRYQPLESPFKV